MSHHTPNKKHYRVLTSQIIFAVITIFAQIVVCNAAMLRGRNDSYATSASRDLFTTQGTEQIALKNSCSNRMRFHMRYFEDELKYTVFDDVRLNQRVNLKTKKKVTVALVAGEQNGNDVFLSKCASGQRGYIRYADGHCYKFYYSAELTFTCDGSEVGNGIRGPGGVTTEGPMC